MLKPAYQIDEVEQEILAPLNEQQRKPVVDFDGPQIILAGAGAGKTKTIVAKAQNMLNHGVKPERVLIFTFTRKGADEIRSRIVAGIGDKGTHIVMGTYHSFCGRLLRRYVENLGSWTRNFSIYDADDSKELLSKIIKDIKDPDNTIRPAQAAHTISHWKERMMSPQDAAQEADSAYYRFIADVYKKYAEALRASNAMDFDDLIYYTIRLFEQFPEIRERVSSRYDYVIADESQDSSPRDLELIYHLSYPKMNVCLVGDDFQSIYGFRGADIDAFFYFVEEFKLKKFELGRNYRSTQTIVNAAASVIANNQKQFEKTIFSKKEVGSQIISYAMNSFKEEALRVVQIVKAMQKKGIELSEIAVLYRMSFLSRTIEEAFISNSVPYKMISGTPFYARKEIKDVLSYLRFCLNPNDQVSMARALSRPKRGVGEASLNKINSCLFANDCAIMSIDELEQTYESTSHFGLKGKAKKGWENFFETIKLIKEDIDNGSTPVEIITRTIALTKYFDFLKEEDPATYDDRRHNLSELLNVASNYESIEEFVNNMVLNETDADEDGNKAERVNMMTIHGSKGGEWKVVIVVGCNQGILPHLKAPREEERRLMYVAMTRAKEYLFLTRAKVMMQQGQPVPQEPSEFIAEIDKQYIRQL